MSDSGLPVSFWVDALVTAVYLKKEYSHAPYAHNKVGPSRIKFAPNCKVGFDLGYQEGRLGCKLYFPNVRATEYALDVLYNEDIEYKDRNTPEWEAAIRDLLYVDPISESNGHTQNKSCGSTERFQHLERIAPSTVNQGSRAGLNSAEELRWVEEKLREFNENADETHENVAQGFLEGPSTTKDQRCTVNDFRAGEDNDNSVFY
ncbi:hypothetical protein PHMEG_00022929 [Phytophthora megakarya]|uniref:Copia type Polyprotein n=1 Tax=Phytophthora megakarya TaxID=4795 RepID=A0A225VJW6_9STRA|nr:hypothetical protein PHMEG_00022929 [Phytophthora megakarya]